MRRGLLHSTRDCAFFIVATQQRTFGEFYRTRTGPVVSFELFPPKTDQAYESLRTTLPDLAKLNPDFITVTYGAMGSTQERTLEIASMVQKQGIPAACHLTCVGASRPQLTEIIQQIHRAGIRNIVALRGDPPQGQTSFTAPADGLGHANELVSHIRTVEREANLSPFGLAVAGYPEKHAEAPSLEADIENLKRKVDAGADIVVTQLFYDNARYFEFVDKARALGISIPIVPGLLPVVSAKQILRITSMCGACLPEGLKAELETTGDDAEKAEEIGVRQCVAQARELLQRGAPGIHFYVLNKSAHMRRIIRQLFPERVGA